MLISVGTVTHGNDKFSHAMVLDTYDQNEDLLIFKNTYNDPANGQSKQVVIARINPNAPKELYFVHMDVRDMNSLPSQKERSISNQQELFWKDLFLKNYLSEVRIRNK